MKKDPARNSKRNVKGKRVTKTCTEKNCPKKKKTQKTCSKNPDPCLPVETKVTNNLFSKLLNFFNRGDKK